MQTVADVDRLVEEAGQLPEGQRITVIERLLATLGLGFLLRQLVPIRHTEGVCGGRACVGDTRIPVWMLIQARRMGTSETQLLDNYPSLTRLHLWAAWRYYEEHAEEIEADIHAQEHDEDEG